jgi:N-acetylneuraminate synthase
MNPYIEISGRKIGVDFPPLIIAEIGINHNGNLKTAFEMVDSASRAGVEVVKHQTHVVEDEMSKAAKKVIPGNADKSIYEIMNDCSLGEEEESKLKEYVESKGMIFLSTPFSRAAAFRLERMGVEAYKIGSGECNNYPLLELIASFGKPVILSTGMNTIETIKKAKAIFESKGVDIALLHTTNLYPTPNSLVRLGALEEMKKVFPNNVIGLSDHTISNHACFGAVALGGSVLERHFTDTMNRIGPDIVCSMDEQACKKLIEGANIMALQRGGKKGPAEEEQVTIDFAFATIVSTIRIKKGEVFTEKNIWVKRPGKGGILAKHYKDILGKKASKNIDADEQIKWEEILN